MKYATCLVRHASLVPFTLSLLFLFNLAPDAVAHKRHTEAAPVARNYFDHLRNHVTWSKLPVSIYFMRDEEDTSARERAVRAGLDLWVQATGGYVGYKVVDSQDRAQITVTFDPSNDDGHTTTSYTSRRIVHARIVMGVDRGSPRDLECTAAHEFAHALGMAGHSDDDRDLMYPAHVMGRSWSITRRDLNTLAMVYHVDSDISADWTPQYVESRRYELRRYRHRESDEADSPDCAG